MPKLFFLFLALLVTKLELEIEIDFSFPDLREDEGRQRQKSGISKAVLLEGI